MLGTFRTPEFTRSELTEIIEDIVIQHESFTSSAVTLEMSKPFPEPVSLPVKIALCRILQEALSNVHRHSGVQEAEVKLWAEKRRLILEVSDQGYGFEPPPLIGPQAIERHEHIGLRLNGLSRAEVLTLSASAERYSENPLAEAVHPLARDQNNILIEPKDFEAVPGYGMRASIPKCSQAR